MENSEIIEQIILNYPVCEYAFGDVGQIPFSDKVWYICQTDCERYGKSWACPPHCGDIDEKIARCRQYDHFLIFSTITEVENPWDSAACLKAKAAHEDTTRSIAAQLHDALDSCYILSTGCTMCEQCACPDEPCRHPEQRFESMESHGIMILQLTDEMGLSHSFDGNTVVYFSMVLF